MTGRGAGFCAGSGVPGYASPGMYGGGRGGWGNRFWFRATGRPGWSRLGGAFPGWPVYGGGPAGQPDPEEEKRYLEGQARMLREQVEEIQKRIDLLGQAGRAE